jgi:N-terminal domain of anti-restriction factor ArdC
MMNEIQSEALRRATQNQSLMNYGAIIQGFMDMGINPQDIKPRENVFTFNAWKAKGRVVRKGQHGVKVCTWVTTEDKETGKQNKFPRTTTVFHESQTETMQ